MGKLKDKAILKALTAITGIDIASFRGTVKDLFEKVPVAKGLKSVDGMFLIPFVLKDWDLSEDFTIADKIKVAIAHNPDSVLAMAYRMGVDDETRGKSQAQVRRKRKSVVNLLKEAGINAKEYDHKEIESETTKLIDM